MTSPVFAPEEEPEKLEAAIVPSTARFPPEERLKTSVTSFNIERELSEARDFINQVSVASSPSSASSAMIASVASIPCTSRRASGEIEPIPSFPVLSRRILSVSSVPKIIGMALVVLIIAVLAL